MCINKVVKCSTLNILSLLYHYVVIVRSLLHFFLLFLLQFSFVGFFDRLNSLFKFSFLRCMLIGHSLQLGVLDRDKFNYILPFLFGLIYAEIV
jgi:hypothetical protein